MTGGPPPLPAGPDPGFRRHPDGRRPALPGTVRRLQAGHRVRCVAAGFTLIEIMVVMVIIAAATLLAAMALTGGFERMKLRSESKAIVASLRYTRAQAIATGVPQRFVIDPRARAWQGADDRHGTIDRKLEVRFTGAREVQPRDGQGAILFFADGASTGGRVQLVSGQAAWNVDVAWLTGEIRLHRGQDVR